MRSQNNNIVLLSALNVGILASLFLPWFTMLHAPFFGELEVDGLRGTILLIVPLPIPFLIGVSFVGVLFLIFNAATLTNFRRGVVLVPLLLPAAFYLTPIVHPSYSAHLGVYFAFALSATAIVATFVTDAFKSNQSKDPTP